MARMAASPRLTIASRLKGRWWDTPPGVPGRAPTRKDVTGASPRSGWDTRRLGGVGRSTATLALHRTGWESAAAMPLRRILVLALTTTMLIAAPAQARLRTFTLRYGPVAMGGFNVKYPRGSVNVPQLDGSIVRMHARLVDARGRRVTIRDVMLHHIVFHRSRPSSLRGACTSRTAEPFYGTGEENQSLILPKGYGYLTRASDRWHMAAMLMSHSERLMNVYIQYTVTIDTSPKLTPVRAFWVRANTCSQGIGYGVAGGGAPGATDTHRFDWKVPISGRIVAAGGHLHGGAEDMWLN